MIRRTNASLAVGRNATKSNNIYLRPCFVKTMFDIHNHCCCYFQLHWSCCCTYWPFILKVCMTNKNGLMRCVYCMVP